MSDPPMIFDESPADATRPAQRYFLDRVDAQLEDLSEEPLNAETARRAILLLTLRYGDALKFEPCAPGAQLRAILGRGQPAPENVEAVAGQTIVRVPWRPQAALEWYRAEIKRRWPTGPDAPTPFVAFDIETLWVVCTALDAARHRPGQVIDDAFPAPPMLIVGPTGVGKELIATAVHRLSEVGKLDFGRLNCAGLPTELLESEMFGHVKGAFTGAGKAKKGIVETYENSSLFFDEVGDMPATVQVKLLRFLNSGEFRPVGANKHKSAHPRVIAATKRDIVEMVRENGFRDDLFFRLSARQFTLRSLAERRESLPALIDDMLVRVAKALNREAPTLGPAAAQALVMYPWPGNMRELKFVAEELVDNAVGRSTITVERLPQKVTAGFWSGELHVAQRDALLAAERARTESETRARVWVALQARERLGWAIGDAAEPTTSERARLIRRFGEVMDAAEVTETLAQAAEAHDRRVRLVSYSEYWRAPLVRLCAEYGLDLDEVLGESDTTLARAIEETDRAFEKAQTQVAERPVESALSWLAGLLGSFSAFPKLNTIIEELLDAMETPGGAELAKLLGQKLSEMTADDLRALIASDQDEGDDEEDDASDDTSLEHEWPEVRKSKALLQHYFDQFESNKTAMAEAFDVDPSTIRRACTKHGVPTPENEENP